MSDKKKATSEKKTALRQMAEAMMKPTGEADAAVEREQQAHLLHELQTHQIELELQNEALSRAYEELEQTNIQLTEAHDRYRDLYDFAPVGFVTLDEKGTVIEANLRLADLLDRERGPLIDRPFINLVIRDDRDIARLSFRRLLDESEISADVCDLRLRRADGGELWVRIDWIVVAPEASRPAIRGAIADITEYKNMQAQLAQADRMASVGLLAAGVAHEINNPLTYVLYHLETLATALPNIRERASTEETTIDELVLNAASAVKGAHRIRDIVQQLRIFSHIDKGRIEPTTISEVIDNAIEMANNELKYRARLVKRYGDVPPIDANPSQLCQVFLNLLVNAAQAIEEGYVEANEIRVRTWQEADRVMVEVADTGQGIPSNHLETIFDPFFTTKEVGTGSGLGLSICKKIITTHDGEISVKSTVGQGTTFTIGLPTGGEGPSLPASSERRQTTEATVTGRVLVIDDEPSVGRVIGRMLSEHDVVVVTSGKQGQEQIESGKQFDVILCDLMMPSVTGMDLYAWVSKTHPELARRMVFMTGGVFTPRGRKFLQEVPNLYLEKPFTKNNLRGIVQNLILAKRSKTLTSPI